MIPKNLWLNSRSFFFLGFFLVGFVSQGQVFGLKTARHRGSAEFLETQFWLGIKSGTSVSAMYAKEQFIGFSPVNYSPDSIQKTYDRFTHFGYFVGLEISVYHKGFSFALQPTFKRSKYAYQSTLKWKGDKSGNSFDSENKINQWVETLHLPLVLKWDMIGGKKIRPFIMAGGYYDFILSAQKSVDVSQVDYFSGKAIPSNGGSFSLGTRDSFKGFFGVTGGAGVNFDFWNIRAILEVFYNYSLSSLTKEGAIQNELIAIGDTNDKLLLTDLNAAISFVFPFRYLQNQFKSR